MVRRLGFSTVLVVSALFLGALCWSAPAATEPPATTAEAPAWTTLRLLTTSPASETAVVQDASGELAVVHRGDRLGEDAPLVLRVLADRIELEERNDSQDKARSRRTRYWMFRAESADRPSRVTEVSRQAPAPPRRFAPQPIEPPRPPPRSDRPEGVRP